MATRGKEVLSDWLGKETFDVRGSETNLFKTVGYDLEAFIHLASFRLSIFTSFIIAIAIFANLIFGYFGGYIEAAIVIAWILITPQLYEVIKAFSLISSHGYVFGQMNKSFLDTVGEKYNKPSYKLLRVLPATAMVIWALALVALIVTWLK